MAFYNSPVIDHARPTMHIYDTYKPELSSYIHPHSTSKASIHSSIVNPPHSLDTLDHKSKITHEYRTYLHSDSPPQLQNSKKSTYPSNYNNMQISDVSKYQQNGMNITSSESNLSKVQQTNESPVRFKERLDDYNSPIARTKYHSNMRYEQISSIRQDQKAKLQEELMKQIEEKKQRDALIKKKLQEDELREEQRFTRKTETYNKAQPSRTEQIKKEPSIIYSEIPKYLPDVISTAPSYRSIHSQNKLPSNVLSYRNNETYSYLENLYAIRNEEKLGLLKEHAALRHKIELIKLEAIQIEHDKHRSLRQIDYLKDQLKRDCSKMASFGDSKCHEYIISDRNCLTFAGKSLMSSSPSLQSVMPSSKKSMMTPSNYNASKYKISDEITSVSSFRSI